MDFLTGHPPAAWALVAGVFLAIEIATGSGWLLWPCAAAAVAALVACLPFSGWLMDLLLFAVLTVAFTIAGRRWMSHRHVVHTGPDLNDPLAMLVGAVGAVTTPFENGRGRVFVSGKDWAADLDHPCDAPVGAPVRVLAVVSSSRLRVAEV